MTLIAGMTSQLGGRSQWQDTKPGTCYTLDFIAQKNPGHPHTTDKEDSAVRRDFNLH